MRHEMPADDLMVEMPLLEHLVVEEMSERAVADVVQQTGDAQRLLDQRRRGRIRECCAKRSVDAAGELARKVHRAEEMCESRMLRTRKHPPRGLELMHAAEALQPDGVEQLPFARLTRLILGDLDVSVQRIRDEVDLAETLRGME